MKSITFLCHKLATTPRGTGTRIAAALGKPYGLLMRELSPNDRGAKFGVDDLVSFCRAVDSVEPLCMMADELGYDVVMRMLPTGEPLADLDAFTALEQVANLTTATGRVADAVLRHIADGEYGLDELEELDRLLAIEQGLLAQQRRAVQVSIAKMEGGHE